MDWTTEQKQAITIDGASVAVSAAAGSGKTAVLTERIIRRVCAPDGSGDISRILAVTFTKAAANELASRVARALSDKLAEDPSNRHIARQSLLVSSAKISTVHRFCLDVIHDNFGSLSLPSDMSVADSARLLMIEKSTMESLIDDYFEGDVSGDAKIDDFGTFADTFGDIKSADALSSRLIKIYDELSSKLKFLDDIDDNIQMYKNVDASNFLDSAWGIELLRYTSDMLGYYKRIFEDALSIAKVNDAYRKAEKTFLSDLEFIDLVMGEIRRGAGYFEISDALSKFAPPSLSFGKGADDKTTEFLKAERKSFKDEISNLKKTHFGFTESEIKYSSAETAKRLSELKVVLAEFDKRFAAEKVRRHIISFSDMEHFALDILWDRESDGPTPAAERLRDSFDEIYVDEYQDTNEVQDKIFSLVSRSDNKFCVGDIKQSIYGFRGAAPYIFTRMLDARKKYEDGSKDTATKVFLSKNFRSSNEIVDFCNAVFDTLMNVETKKYGDDERLYAGLEKSCGDVEASYIQNGDDDTENSEADYVAKRVAALARGGRHFSEIAVLLRNGTHADEFKRALEKLNIPCKNTTERGLLESPEVLLMLSILNAIDNPARDVYLAATLKSPVFGVSLDELMFIRRYAGGSLYDALVSFTEEKKFKKGERALSFIKRSRALAQSLSCDELIWQIYMELGLFSLVGETDGDENYSAEQAKANLIQLYNYARSFGGGAYRNLYDFITFINSVLDGRASVDLSQYETTGDAVEITTMHNSKGLEYPVCFVSGLGGDFSRIGMSGDVIITSAGIVPKIVHPSGFGKIVTPQYHISLISEKRTRLDDEMRLLYVALTRAREKLIITAKPDKRSKKPKTFDLSAHGVNALRGKYLSGYSMLKMTKFIDFLGAALAGKDKCRLADSVDDAVPFDAGRKSDGEKMTLIEAKKLVSDRLSFKYRYEELSKVPSKTAVSKLYPDLLDENETEAPTCSFDYVPRFLSDGGEEVSAAERGTATHTFMQFFDFDRVKAHGVRAEAEYLAENGFIFKDDLKKIDFRGVERFFDSDIAQKMRKATKIWREKRFILAFDASGFTEDDALREKLKGEKMLVQGVIDCAYEDDDGKIVLIDYKTDHFKRGTPREEIISTLADRHKRQMTYYKKACAELFGEVSHVYIYSFAVGDTVEINTED